MRRCSRRSSTYWSAAAPGGLCRRVSDIETARPPPLHDLVAGWRLGAASTKPSCTGSTTPASWISPAWFSTLLTYALKEGRTHRSEPRGPRQAGFQDARPVGRERTAPGRRDL